MLIDLAWLAAAPSNATIQDPFQKAVAGLGGGHAVGVDWSFFAYDPRRATECENEWFPIPGLPCPNPHHGASAVDRPALDSNR